MEGFSHGSKLNILARVPEIIIHIWNSYLKFKMMMIYSKQKQGRATIIQQSSDYHFKLL